MKRDLPFFNDVYEVVKLVPPGRVTSYGAIARYLGTSGSARMVGWALNKVVNREEIPAHRVVNRMGLLSGKHHFGSLGAMQKKLEDEGIIVVDDKVVDFDKLFWNPSEELNL